MGAPIGGFFDGADVVFTTPTSSATAPGVPAKATTLPTEPVPINEGTYTGKVSEAIPVPAETLTPHEVATPPATIQTEAASLITPLIIFTSDPFAILSQAVKDGSSLVVTPSSIPSSATCGPNVDLSSEGSKDVLGDPDDDPILKKRIFDFDNEESVPLEAEVMGMCLSTFLLFLFLPSSFSSPPFFGSSFPYTYVLTSPLCCNLPLFVCLFPCFVETFEGLGVVVDVGMPSAAAPATPITPVSAIPIVPVSAVPFVLVSTVLIAPILTGPGELLISFLFSLSRFYCS